MELKRGYSQTEVGVIPDDWGVSTVGNEFCIQLGKMLDSEKNVGVAKPYLGNRAVQWRRIDVSNIGLMKMTPSDLQRFLLRSGDLLVCEGGEIGRAAIWDEQLPECYYQKALHRLRPVRGYDPSLMLYILERWCSTGFLSNFATQTSIAHLPKDRFERVPLPVPPTQAEQLAIAEALGDADAMIERLDKLIAKKRDIKHAAMQQLLTGKNRLPRFGPTRGHKRTKLGLIPNDWDVKPAEALCLKIQDGTHFSPTVDGGEYLYVTSKNVHHGRLDVSDAGRINASQHQAIYRRCDVKRGDLLLTKDGANTGNAALNTLDEEFSLLSSVALLRFNTNAHAPAYYLHQILSEPAQMRIKELMSGNAISRLTLAKIRKLLFMVPPLPEQRAIAQVLSDMDAEITALEARCNKARAIKVGMMQALLTEESDSYEQDRPNREEDSAPRREAFPRHPEIRPPGRLDGANRKQQHRGDPPTTLPQRETALRRRAYYPRPLPVSEGRQRHKPKPL
jgi:type I restriction enzyme S subunit